MSPEICFIWSVTMVDDVSRGDTAEHANDFVGQIVDGEKAGDRDQCQDRRKQREEEVIRLLSCQVEHVVGQVSLTVRLKQLAHS